MNTKTLKDLFLDELADMYDAERRIAKALPKLAKAATSPDLKAAFESHLEETEGHVQKLEAVFHAFDEKAKGKTCEATVGLLKEGDEIAAEFKGSPALNAALIAAAQKVEHYEMASYGCLHEWAGLLGNQEAAGLLKQILEEEKGANESLNELAHDSLNQEALGEPVQNGSPDKAADKSPGKVLLDGQLPARSKVRPLDSREYPQARDARGSASRGEIRAKTRMVSAPRHSQRVTERSR
jgi:ferritin-like metal-binding protein YciE